MLEAKFRWIRDDVRLIARVDERDGDQQLVMQHFDPNTGRILLEDAIDCIHVAVCEIPSQEFEETTQKADFEETVLDLQSSEFLREIKLEPEEKFKALSSWVSGIAEAGENSFHIQAEIEAYAQLAYPFTNRLLRFVVQVDPSFLGQYLDNVCRECRYEGVLHRASLWANLFPIIDVIKEIPSKIPSSSEILEALTDIIVSEGSGDSEKEQNWSLATLWGSLGYALMNKNEFQEAINAFERSIKFWPKDVRAWLGFGSTLLQLQDYFGAIAVSHEAIRIRPYEFDAWKILALARSATGDLVGAAMAFRKCIRIDRLNAFAWVKLGQIRWDQHDFQRAIDAWEAATEADPDDSQTWYYLGVAYNAQGNRAEAHRCFARAISLCPPTKFLLSPAEYKPKHRKRHYKHWTRSWEDEEVTKARLGIRANRNAILKKGEYEKLLDMRAEGHRRRGYKDAKSNRHHDGTRRNEAYRAWGRNKRLEQPVDFLTALAD